MNVLAARSGQDRWSRMPDEVLRYLLGHFGEAPGPVDQEVAARAADNPRTRELDKSQPEPELADLRRGVQEKTGRSDVADAEVLLRTVLPAEQVDAIVAPAPAWDPDGTTGPGAATTAAEFVREVVRLPHWRELDVRLGDERVQLRRGDDGGER